MQLAELLSLPFDEYIIKRSSFAIERLRKDNLITIDYYGLSLLQALWAREYWFNRNA